MEGYRQHEACFNNVFCLVSKLNKCSQNEQVTRFRFGIERWRAEEKLEYQNKLGRWRRNCGEFPQVDASKLCGSLRPRYDGVTHVGLGARRGRPSHIAALVLFA